MIKTLTQLYQDRLFKYSPDQPRDDGGKWTAGGGTTGRKLKEFTPDIESYKGYAKDTGLDKKGLTDHAIDWLETWQKIEDDNNAKRIGVPTKNIVDTLSKFKPSNPVKLYRGIPSGGSKAGSMASKTGLESWTYGKSIANEWAGKDGTVETRMIHPKDILVDYGKLPKDYFDINENVEREVIVRAGK